MGAPGTYTEKLSCGGNLSVTHNSWRIEYYFPGPDLRYSGTFFSVAGEQLDSFIDALRQNWMEYEQLRKSIPEGGTFTKPGKEGMMIHIGGPFRGVCLVSYHNALSSQAEIEDLIQCYKFAQKRAQDVQRLFENL